MSEELHLKLFWSSPFDGGMAEKKRLYLGEVKMSGEKVSIPPTLPCQKHSLYPAVGQCISSNVYQQRIPLVTPHPSPPSPRGLGPREAACPPRNGRRLINEPFAYLSCRVVSRRHRVVFAFVD